MKTRLFKLRMLPAVAGLVLGGSALAGYTTINGPAAGELSLEQIFETLYDATINPVGVDFVGSTVSLIRVDDFGLGGTMNIKTGVVGASDDQHWGDGTVAAEARARYAGDNQDFGYITGPDGAGSYNSLFPVGGSGFGVTGNATQLIGPAFRWGRAGGGIGGTHSSLDSENGDQLDHLVSYEVLGLNNGAIRTWVLAWEDRNMGQPNGDFDYNDLIVEIRVVPTPIAAGMGLLGLGGVAGIRRRRTV